MNIDSNNPDALILADPSSSDNSIDPLPSLVFKRASAAARSHNAATARPIKFRARLPKVKTGCHNCKTRRIKCDETKPGCVRCFKFGILCSGYPKPQEKTKPKARSIVPILPKGATTQPATPSIYGVSTRPLHLDEQAGRYFRYFCEEVAPSMCNPFSSMVWNTSVPQVSEVEDYISHGLIAVGALSMSRKERLEGNTVDCNRHLEFALSQYGKSLRGMQTSLQSIAQNPRIALISCLMVFCMEAMQGHQEAAAIHAMHGITMLRKSYGRTGEGSMTRLEWAQKNYMGEFYETVNGLDLQVLYFADYRPQSFHQTIMDDLNKEIHGKMPLVFDHPEHCHRFWQIIMRRNLHFIDIARKTMNISNCTPPTKEWDNVSTVRQTNSVWVAGVITSGEIPILQQRDTYLEDITRWEKASAPLFDKCMALPQHHEDFITATSLKAQVAAHTIRVQGSFFEEEIEYDALGQHFKVIVECCTAVHAHYTKASYHSSLGIIMPLFEVGMHCRDRILRDQAISLMFINKEYKEGIWDSYLGGFICKWLRDLEEPWRDENGFIPADRRAKGCGLNASVVERRAQMFCRQKNGPGNEDIKRDIIVTW